MKVKKLFSTCAVVLLSFGIATATYAEKIQIWGSTTCQKRFLEPGNTALKSATGVDVKVMGVGTGKGLIALLEGKAAASASSSPLESAIKSAQKSAKKQRKQVVIPDDLQFHEVSKDVIVPIVHRDNPVTALTWQQLKDIHTGKVKNWQEVGGADLPIRVVTSHEGSATRAVFQKQVMKKEPYVGNAVKVRSTRIEINEVSKYKGAIGAVSEGFFKLNPGKAKMIETDTIARPLALITLGEPSPAMQKVIAFYRSEEAKKYFQ